MQNTTDFIIVGAGISGLAFAKQINELGYSLAVFEKARGTGGRLSSKRKVYGDNLEMAFDLGCSSIAAKSSDFARQLEDWHLKGVISPWWQDQYGTTHYVPTPRNSALTRHLSKDLDCHFSTKVTKIMRCDGIWQVFYEASDGKIEMAKARHIILAMPSPQAHDLLPESSSFRKILTSSSIFPQWVMGIKVSMASEPQVGIEYPQSSIIHSISYESSKPHRTVDPEGQVLQIQATSNWSLNNVDEHPDDIALQLTSELKRVINSKFVVESQHVHRWLYSGVAENINTEASAKGYLWDGNNGLGIIGDYLTDSLYGVESAWLSASHLADLLVSSQSAGKNN